jgi:hypothetical protein
MNAMRFFNTNEERHGSCYHEFYPGKWDGETFWSQDSLYLDDDILTDCPAFEKAISAVIPAYDPYGVTVIGREEWKQIGQLAEKAGEMAAALYTEADAWATAVLREQPCFTILGI